MSTQSIKEISKDSICNEIDNFLICEGNYFRNIIDYDIKHKLDYKKINTIILFKEMIDRKNDCEKILTVIDKILI